MAIANDIALYALGYWSHEQHPLRINAICLNVKQRKTPCSACTDSCPQGIVMHSGKVNWVSCTNCNLCVTACPTAAINQSSTSFSAIRQTILEGSAPISFACERLEEPSDVRCVCLATIPWDLLAAAALSCGVVVKADACKDCPHTSFVDKVKHTIRELRRFLGDEQFKTSVFLHDQPGMQRSAGIDRRLAFGRFANSVAQGAEVALGTQERPTMSCYRALLLEVLESRVEEGNPAEVHWQVLTEDGNCRGCEICTKMCPHKALELHIPGYTDQEDEAEESAHEDSDAVDAGTGNAQDAPGETGENAAGDAGVADSQDQQSFFIQNASKCTQCGLCYVSCPEETLGGWDRMSTRTVPAMKAWPIHVRLCDKCGRPFRPSEEDQTRCSICSRKGFSLNK